MPTPSPPLWEIEPHTKAKHAILSEYLKAWFQILGRNNLKVGFIDGFGGPGRYLHGEPGSPLIALDIAIKSGISSKILFQFVEENKERFQYLKNEIAELKFPPSFEISIKNESFANILSSILDYLERNSFTPSPIFAFIDPFGFKDVPFSLIQRLLSFERCEVFINFMVDSINRWLEHPEDGIRSHIYALLGSDDTHSIIHSENRVISLRNMYEDRLRGVAKFVLPFEMKNKQDRTQFFLFFASNHRLGHIKMKEAMWRIDENGDFSFSDASHRKQSIFRDFDLEQKIRSLQSDILQKFGGCTCVPSRTIQQYVEDETIFLRKHMIKALKIAEEENKIFVRPTTSDGKTRRKNSFSENTLVDFC